MKPLWKNGWALFPDTAPGRLVSLRRKLASERKLTGFQIPGFSQEISPVILDNLIGLTISKDSLRSAGISLASAGVYHSFTLDPCPLPTTKPNTSPTS